MTYGENNDKYNTNFFKKLHFPKFWQFLMGISQFIIFWEEGISVENILVQMNLLSVNSQDFSISGLHFTSLIINLHIPSSPSRI